MLHAQTHTLLLNASRYAYYEIVSQRLGNTNLCLRINFLRSRKNSLLNYKFAQIVFSINKFRITFLFTLQTVRIVLRNHLPRTAECKLAVEIPPICLNRCSEGFRFYMVLVDY